MQNFNLAQKEALADLITGGVEPYFLSYDPTEDGTETLEADAIAAGYVEYYREDTANLVEIIYTK